MAKKKKGVTTPKEITDIDIVDMLSRGVKVSEISKELGVNIRTLEAGVIRIRDRRSSTNVAHLVGNYFRKKLIK